MALRRAWPKVMMLAVSENPASVEIQVSRAARRIIARRYGGCIYVWPYQGDAPTWLDRGPPLEAAKTPPAGDGDFWRHDVGEIAVFTRADLAPGDDFMNVLFLDHRRRRGIVARWTHPGTGGLVLTDFVFSLWPFK